MNSFIFLFLFYTGGNSPSYTVVPQPSIEVCEINGNALTNDYGKVWKLRSAPFNHYQCIDMSKPLVNFKWDMK